MDESRFTYSSVWPAKPFARFFLLIVLVSGSQTAFANEPPPNVDFFGGYYDGNVYRCYAEPCFRIYQEANRTGGGREFKANDWPHWIDIDDNCQNEREQIVATSSQKPVRYQDDDKCGDVVAGKWVDPYNGKTIEDIAQIEVDHRVSLEEAHRYGGLKWHFTKRAKFANLPQNLVVVSAKSKRSRDGRSASEWMPENKAYWCDYVVHREVFARKMGLSFPAAEQAFNKKIKTLYCKY